MKTARLLLVAALALSAAHSPHAQGTRPDKPVRIIVPLPPGGPSALDTALKHPDVVERLRQSDQAVVADSPDDTATRLAADAKTWGAVVRRVGLLPD